MRSTSSLSEAPMSPSLAHLVIWALENCIVHRTMGVWTPFKGRELDIWHWTITSSRCFYKLLDRISQTLVLRTSVRMAFHCEDDLFVTVVSSACPSMTLSSCSCVILYTSLCVTPSPCLWHQMQFLVWRLSLSCVTPHPCSCVTFLCIIIIRIKSSVNISWRGTKGVIWKPITSLPILHNSASDTPLTLGPLFPLAALQVVSRGRLIIWWVSLMIVLIHSNHCAFI